jgi:hypothetical protein
MYNLNTKKQETILSVSKGELLQYEGFVHGSVGFFIDYKIENSTILKLQTADIQYENPENMQTGMTGGDAGKQVLVFETLAAGESYLEITHYFRNELESQKNWKIIVLA